MSYASDGVASWAGVSACRTSRPPGPVPAKGNQLWANRAPDQFYGYDGGAFEVFGAQGVTMTENLMWDNKDVLETGTPGTPCTFSFTRNVAYAASSVPSYARGMVIACGSDTLVANNTLRDFDISAISVVNKDGYTWGGSVDRLKVVNNVLVTNHDRPYYFDNVPSTVTVDHNLLRNSGGSALAYVVGKGTASSLDQIRSLTGRSGIEVHGLVADPKFVDAGANDYHLQAGSPAIDRGTSLGGVTDGFAGSAPDLGRFESGFEAPSPTPSPSPSTNLLANGGFGTDTKGWRGWQGNLSRVSGGQSGDYAAKVAFACPSGSTCGTYSLDDSPDTVANPAQGATYTAEIWVKAASSSAVGKRIDLILREQGGATGVEQTANATAVTLTNSWQRIMVTRKVARSGRTGLDVFAIQRNAASGDAFFADSASLIKVS
ncbi:MAG TPA: carbohydrate binding domain-containing protein [Nonomuraea sp.]|nr:carbohydrate binding domain-containing protein [Nonomuraea sp.]